MRDNKIMFATGKPLPTRWPEPADEEPRHSAFWRLARWFERSPPTLYQRCLAVHMYYAGKQRTLH